MPGRALILTLSIYVSASIRGADLPPDPVVTLAQILATKGTITAADVASVTAVSTSTRVRVLASILQGKGLLNESELAEVWSGSASAARSPMIPPTVAEARAPQTVVPRLQPTPAATTSIPVTTKESVAVSMYGTVLLNAFFNTAPTNIQDIPLAAIKQGTDLTGGDKNFGMTARQTRIGLRLHATNVARATLSGEFEFDMVGGKTPLANGIHMDIFRLRLAYGRLDWKRVAFEAGQDWAIFSPLNPTSYAAYAIPEFSESGNPWIRTPQIRGEFTRGAKEATHWLFQLAALDPNIGDNPLAPFSTSRQPGIGERGRMPALESRVAWTYKPHQRAYTIGLSGHYGRGKNFGIVNGVPAFPPVDSWGVNLDYSLPFSRRFNLTGEAFVGRALGMFSVTGGETIGVVRGPGEHGVESRGGWIQAQFDLSRRWQLNLAYGLEVPNASQLVVGSRWRNQTYMGNLIFKLTPNVIFAGEYRRLLTDYRNQPFGNERGDHVNLAVGYIF
jgi:hypothetical protein